MLAKVTSFSIMGLEAYPVVIEVDVAWGLPAVYIVGLPDNAVKESKERVRSAIKNSGYQFPSGRITINLSPANTKKEGPAFDLAIALGLLAASEQLDPECLRNWIILGELSLDGRVQPVRGTLAVAMAVEADARGIILPGINACEAAIVRRVPVFPMKTLNDVVYALTHPQEMAPFVLERAALEVKPAVYDVDFNEVKGQTHVRRGIEVAAAGGHNLLMLGPPGSGKTMLAKRVPTILPDMTMDEALETTKIYSVMGLVPPQEGLVRRRPFRSPHHTASDAAIVGGGSIPRPGEITLAHNGVLFLDELPEFSRNALETLRQPLEERCVTIARASRSVKFPAQVMLVASMNPCPCGYLTDPQRPCQCTPMQIQRYLGRISGPLLDRIDIHLEVPALKPAELMTSPVAEGSAAVKARTVAARAVQHERFKDTRIFANAQMNQRQIKTHCALTPEGRDLLQQAIEDLGLSARAHDRILKVSRTIADLAGAPAIQPEHLAEAIQYRTLDRQWR